MLAPNYARVEQGRANVTVDTLVRVANAFEVPVAALFKKPKATTVATGRPAKRS
jgi:transcriptional regulator with XRE-family HTH domain